MTSSASDQKHFISASELHAISVKLAEKIGQSGFKPTFLIALWRGGCYIGTVVQEFLQYVHKIKIDHVAVRTHSRDSNGLPLPEVVVHAIGHALSVLTPDDNLLIVDDVVDSGRSLVALLKRLHTELGDRMPREVKVAVPYYKPKRNRTTLVPDFFVESTDAWLVFPHELEELTDAEIEEHYPDVYEAAQRIRALTAGKE